MELIDSKDFSEDTKYNLPGGKITVHRSHEGSIFDLLLFIEFEDYVISLGYKLNGDFVSLSFGSVDFATPIDANSYQKAELLVRLLTPSLKVYTQKILNTLPTTKSNIIIGRN